MAGSTQPKLYQIEEFTDFLQNANDGDLPSYNDSTEVFDPVDSSALIFGQNFQQSTDDTESGTSSTSYVQKLRMTTPSLPSGTYRIGYTFEWRHTGSSNDYEGRVQINDSINLSIHNMEPKDTKSYFLVGGFGFYTGSGVLNIDLDYASESGNATSFVRRVRLEIWRVS